MRKRILKVQQVEPPTSDPSEIFSFYQASTRMCEIPIRFLPGEQLITFTNLLFSYPTGMNRSAM
jgi:hypothetical protein